MVLVLPRLEDQVPSFAESDCNRREATTQGLAVPVIIQLGQSLVAFIECEDYVTRQWVSLERGRPAIQRASLALECTLAVTPFHSATRHCAGSVLAEFVL